MRKHFLILMLLSLLPLAGWAQIDISGVTPTIAQDSYYYTNATPSITMTVKNPSTTGNLDASDFDLVYFNANEESIEASAVKAVATYYVAAKGKGSYGGTSKKVQFNIVKMPLVIKGGTVATAITYGDEEPATYLTLGVGATIKDKVGSTDRTAALKDKITFGRDKSSNKNAGSYALTATITDAALAKNYTVNSEDIVDDSDGQIYFTINKKAFVNTAFETVTIAAVDYDGTEKKPTFTLTDKDLSTVSKDDYTVNYSDNTNAGTATITLTGKRNYTSVSFDVNFTINAATLVVTPTAKKVYDGNNNVPAKVAAIPATGDYLYYAYQGFVDTKNASNVDNSAATVTTTAPAVGTVGKYDLTVDDASKHVLTNYSAYANKGTFEITQREVKVTATDVPGLAYGAAENFTVSLTDGTYVVADATAIKDAVKVVKADAANEDGEWTLTPAFKTAAEIEADFAPAAGATAAEIEAANAKIAKAKAVLVNYTINPVAGKLTYAAAPLKIGLNESKYTLTKVYDGQDVTITKPASEDDLLIIGKQNESDVIDLSGLTVTITAKTATNKTLSNVDTYQITLSGAKADNYAITYIPSQFTITKKALNVKVFDQTLVKGEEIPLNTTLYEIDSEKGLASTDKAEEVFTMVSGVTFDEDGKVTSSAGTYTISIEASNADATKTKWGNYSVTVTNGTATVYASAIALDDTKSLVNLIAADQTGAVVTFSSRNLNAEKWNVLVLPFDITVKDLSAAFSYAVIDVLDQNASDGNVHFKLAVSGTIKANTPFLIYPDNTYNNLNQVTFTGVDVKKASLSKATVSVSDKGGNKFVGTYANTDIFGAEYQYLSQGTFYDAANYTEASPVTIKPLRAYLDLSGSKAAAPVIFIEEPDGVVTSINTIARDSESLNTEGAWYNLNGMKVEGKPTQKGIYIKNGKKVVIK